MTSSLRIHRWLAHSAAEGPGERAVVWVQGCSIRCPGCFNPGTWNPRLGQVVEVAALAEHLLADERIEGVTFLGGEPFEQAAALAELGALAQARDLSVMTFTGYELEQLVTAEARALLAVTDLLVDGPYRAAEPDHDRPWVGSRNQRFHCLTERYRDLIPHLPALPDKLEIVIRRDGQVAINGMAGAAQLEALLDGLGTRQRSLTSPPHGRGPTARPGTGS